MEVVATCEQERQRRGLHARASSGVEPREAKMASRDVQSMNQPRPLRGTLCVANRARNENRVKVVLCVGVILLYLLIEKFGWVV